MIGEIGGNEEQEAARYLRASGLRKPVVAFIAGQYAPPQRRMGHAGTLTLLGRGDAGNKIAELQDAGVMMAPSAHLVGATMREVLAKRAA
jgi:succinyl-CoA synthetase alpha subunit